MTVDSYVLWRITKPLSFYQSLGSISVAEERLDAITYNAFKNVMGTLAQSDIINEEEASGRNSIYANLTASVDALAESYGIDIIDVKIKRFDLPVSNENAVYERMISERRQMAASYTANGEYEASLIRNDVDRQVNIIVSNAEAEAAKLVSEGEAEYMRMLAAAYNTADKQAFYEFTLSLEALRDSLKGGNKTIILGSDSALAGLVSNPD
jgi:modulator of FtsH protease HflC